MKYPILAIDYGDKHFGLAISDSKGVIASPLEVLSITKNKTVQDIIEEILLIAKEYNVKQILIGLPQVFTPAQEKSKEKIMKFSEMLKSQTTIEIIFYDESFSTIQAQNMLTFSGQNTKRSREKIDKIAATVFLQEFLNSKQNQNEK